jgi:hypothetical protein
MQPPQTQQKRGSAGLVVLWIFVGIVTVGLMAGGVYMWQQQRVDSLANSNTDLTKRLADAQSGGSSASTTTFGESKVPFTFTYPSDWVLGSDAAILADKELPISYSITLLAPGTINTQTAANGSSVSAGAIINIAVLPASTLSVKDLVPKPTGSPAPTTTDVTVSNNPGVQYQLVDNGAARMYTDTIKNKVEYRISFEAKGDLKSNQYYGAYTALISSFKLK